MKTILQSENCSYLARAELGEEAFDEIKQEILYTLKSHGVSLAQAKNIFENIIFDIEDTPLKQII